MNDERMKILHEQIRAGDSVCGHALITRLSRLAARTDDEQMFMYRNELFHPQDARDLFAYLASVGVDFTIITQEPA